jgi:hypothetical protein
MRSIILIFYDGAIFLMSEIINSILNGKAKNAWSNYTIYKIDEKGGKRLEKVLKDFGYNQKFLCFYDQLRPIKIVNIFNKFIF